MAGGGKSAMRYNIATTGFNIAANLNPIGAIQAAQSAISIARTTHAAMASLSVSFAGKEAFTTSSSSCRDIIQSTSQLSR
jgi:hypothetical protein